MHGMQTVTVARYVSAAQRCILCSKVRKQTNWLLVRELKKMEKNTFGYVLLVQ